MRGTRTYHFGIGLALIPLPQAQMSNVQLRGGNRSRDYVLRAGELGIGDRAGRRDPAMRPPTSPRPTAWPVVTAANPPVAATGFNVYMGLSPKTVTLQNSAPVAVGASFTLPSSGLVIGEAPGSGQAADVYVAGRSHAEARVSDGDHGKRGGANRWWGS